MTHVSHYNPATAIHDHTWALVRVYAQTLADQHPEIREIRMFGNCLHSMSAANTFIDLLVILKNTRVPIERRHMAYSTGGFRLAINSYAITERELRSEIRHRNYPLLNTLQESRRIFPAT